MTKIGELQPKGAAKIAIYYDGKAKANRYRVFKEWKEPGPCGLRNRRKMIAQYADMYSCALVLCGYAMEHNEESR